MNAEIRHRLSGLEPDNLLAFMALLGLLRVLEEAEPSWLPRVSWTVDDPPVRPVLHVAQPVSEDSIVTAVAAGLAELAGRHRFEPVKDLKLSPEDAAGKLRASRDDRYAADLWAALVSDAAIRDRDKQQEAEPTPLCLLFGQGRQHFLERLGSVLQERTPPARGTGRSKVAITEGECLREALFLPWERLDATKKSFRWDPHEDVRHALRATDPTDAKTKETTQHGANRLAAVGLSVLTVTPRRRGPDIRLELLGGSRDHGEFSFTWPIWRAPISLAAARALIGHGGLDDEATRAALGVTGRQRARRISSGRYMNFTRAETIDQR